MNSKVFCEFNMDTGCVELQMTDGTRISIDCTAVENEIADNMLNGKLNAKVRAGRQSSARPRTKYFPDARISTIS